jgi:hypothetical protein
MNTYTCTACHKAIPAGMAVQRSISFVRVAYHIECHAVLTEAQAIVTAAPIHTESLSQRLARVQS